MDRKDSCTSCLTRYSPKRTVHRSIKCTKCASKTFGLTLFPLSILLSNYHFWDASCDGSMLLFLPCSLHLDGSPAALSAVSQQHRQQLSLHNPRFQFFPPPSLCNLFHACHSCQYNFLHHVLQQKSFSQR